MLKLTPDVLWKFSKQSLRVQVPQLTLMLLWQPAMLHLLFNFKSRGGVVCEDSVKTG